MATKKIIAKPSGKGAAIRATKEVATRSLEENSVPKKPRKGKVPQREPSAEDLASAPELTAVQIWQAKMAKEEDERAEKRKNAIMRPTGGKKHGILTLELMEKICARIATGEALQNIADDEDMPSTKTFFYWVNKDDAYAKLYNEALRLRGENFADETSRLSDEARRAPPELTNAYRLAVDTRKWVAARLLPKKWGDRVVIAGDAENPLQVKHVTDANDLMARIKGEKK